MSEAGLDALFEQYPNKRREDLIPLLQSMQDAMGHLTTEGIAQISAYLKIPISKVYGVATFYDNFRFGPVGRYHVCLCQGTACHVAGAETLLQELTAEMGIGQGETDKEGLFSLEVVSCIGACGLAPLITVNGEYHARQVPADIGDLLQEYKNQPPDADES